MENRITFTTPFDKSLKLSFVHNVHIGTKFKNEPNMTENEKFGEVESIKSIKFNYHFMNVKMTSDFYRNEIQMLKCFKFSFNIVGISCSQM